MKKVIIICAMLLIGGVNLYPAEICFTIDNGKIQRIIDAMKGLSPKEPGYSDA